MSPRRSAPGEILFEWVQVFSRLTPASNNNLDERWEFLWGGAHCRGTEWSGGFRGKTLGECHRGSVSTGGLGIVMNSVSGGMVFWAPAVTPAYSLQTSLYSAFYSTFLFHVTNTLIRTG